MAETESKGLKHSDLVFLWNEVQLAADVVLEMVPAEDVFAGMTCSEAEKVACIFAAAGRQDAYDFIIDQHKVHDEPEELEFHESMKDEEGVRGCSCGMADHGAPGHDGHKEEAKDA